jgi:hypothetical protein
MDKTEAYELFGGRIGLAKALKCTPQNISQWPAQLKRSQALLVIGLLFVTGRVSEIRGKWIKKAAR